MQTLFTAPQPTTVEIAGGGAFPVRRVYCVGRNYRAHAIEMGVDPDRESPFYFLKPTDSLVPSGSTIDYPPRTSDYHHEIELVVAIGKGGRDIPVEQAAEHIFGHAVGLDMTRRDLQVAARKAGRPWDMGKGFDQSAPCGLITPAKLGEAPLDRGAISVAVNGDVRQRSDLSLLIWSAAEVIADLSTYGELVEGDLIFTGTPEGVGPVNRGDTLVGRIEGLHDLTVSVR